MRYFGLVLCLIGALITAAGVVGYFADYEGLGIAGFVLGLGFGAIGVMAFMTNFFLRLFQRNATLLIKLVCLGLRLEVRGEMGASNEGVEAWRCQAQSLDQKLQPGRTYVEANS